MLCRNGTFWKPCNEEVSSQFKSKIKYSYHKRTSFLNSYIQQQKQQQSATMSCNNKSMNLLSRPSSGKITCSFSTVPTSSKFVYFQFIGRFPYPPGGRDSMGGIFNTDTSVETATPRSPFKTVASPYPQPTNNMLHYDSERCPVETSKPLRKQSLSSLQVNNRNSMKNILQNPQISPCNARRVRMSPGGPTTIVLG